MRALLLLLGMSLVPLAAGAQGPSPTPEPPEGQEVEPAEPEPVEGPTAGWLPDEGGFVIKDAEGNYKLRLGLQSAYRYEPVIRDGDAQSRASFFVVRPLVSGTVYRPWVRYWVSMELANNPPHLLDGYIEAQPIDEFGLRFGQQYTPFSRHETFGPQEILFPDWALVANYFWNGRQKGLEAFGNIGDGFAEYWAGLYAASPIRDPTTEPGSWLTEARLTISPLGPTGPIEMPYTVLDEVPFRFSFTVQGYAGDFAISEANLNPSSGLFTFTPTGGTEQKAAWGGDVTVQVDRLYATVEGYGRRIELEDDSSFWSYGVWGQAGYVVWRKDITVGLRYNWLDPSDELDNDNFNSLEAMVAWFVVPKRLHLHIRYGIGEQDDPSEGTDEPLEDVLGPVALGLPPGTSQVLTFQAGVYF